MALVVNDRVKETSTTTGTGTFTLDGAVTGFETFSHLCREQSQGVSDSLIQSFFLAKRVALYFVLLNLRIL